MICKVSPNPNNSMTGGPAPHGAPEPPYYLLEGQYSRAQAIQEVYGVH